jgi:hypothetical protein
MALDWKRSPSRIIGWYTLDKLHREFREVHEEKFLDFSCICTVVVLMVFTNEVHEVRMD